MDFKEHESLYDFIAADGEHYNTMQEVEAANRAYWQHKNPMIKENKLSYDFIAADGEHYNTMQEVEAANRAYWQYKNPMIIDKDSELFDIPLSKEELDKIVASQNYRCLIDILEEQLKKQQSNVIKK